MAWSSIPSALEALIGRRRADRELAEEIRHHLDLETEYRIDQGEAPKDARQTAIRAFGNTTRVAEEVRDERGGSRIESVLKELAFAVRSLRRDAGLTTIVVLALGVGIGAATALFAVVRSALLTPLPYENPAGIVTVWSAWKDFDRTWLSYDEYEAWQAEIPAFASIALFASGAVNLTGGDQPERVRSAQVGADLFRVLGVTPIRGRGFSEDEDRPGGPSVAVISHELWSRRFGADPAIVGGTIEVNGASASLLGVLPPGFKLPLDFGADGATDVYLPLATDAAQQGAVPGPAMNPGGGSHNFYAVARLAPGATAAQADAQLRERAAGFVRDNIYTAAFGFRAFTIPVDDLVSGEVRQPLLVLLGAVGIVLLIACANVAGLLLVRGERRRRELAVRTALGAGQARLVRLLFIETGVLAAAGAVAGIVIAWLTVAAIRQLGMTSLPRVAEARIDPLLLGVALLIATLTAILTGILPSLQVRQLDPADELHESGHRASAGKGRLRWRQTLVTAEIALAVVLVTGAGLLVRTVRNLLALDPGFDPRGVLTMRLSTPSTWYGDSAAVAGFWNTLTAEVGRIPGVRSVGAVRLLPLATDMGDWGMAVEGYTPPPNQGTPGDWQIVTPGGLEAMGYRLLEGRLLDSGDDLNGPLAMVVNRTFVDRYLGGRSALGTRVLIGSSLGLAAPPYHIVGVVEDVHHNTLKSTTKPGFYVTVAQFAQAPGSTIRSLSLAIRTDGDPKALIAPVRNVVRQVDPRLPISEIRTMEEIVGASIAAPHFAMRLLSSFGIIALGLAAIGIFGIVSHAVAVRRQEFGIRAALGAPPIELLRAGLWPGLRQTAAGIAIGTALALGLTGLLSRVLEGVSPTDPLTFVAVILLTGLVAFIASFLPAVRAARVPPGSVLRGD